MNEMAVNNKEYGENRFTSGLREENEGKDQTLFFYQSAVEELPQRYYKQLKENPWTLIDYGCGEGSGTAYIASQFPDLYVVGIDFLSEAISGASEKHPECRFMEKDTAADLEKAQVVFSLYTQEHFENPLDTLEHLVTSSERFAFFLFPYSDDQNKEVHSSGFDIGFFPVVIAGHKVVYSKIIDCQFMKDGKQPGKQILLVYSCDPGEQNMLFENLYNGWISELIESKRTYEEVLKSVYRNVNKKDAEIASALERIDFISHLTPYRIAHYFMELQHAFFGSKEDRVLGKKYIFKSRYTVTKYNYMDEIRNIIRKVGDTSLIRESLNSLKTIGEGQVIRKIIARYEGRNIYVIPAVIDWNVPLFQRPQQIAMGMAHNGALFIYLTTGNFDHIDQPVMIEENLVLAKKDLLPAIFAAARDLNKHVVLDLYSTANEYGMKWLKKWKEYDYSILYEYIDEISEEISGQEVPASAIRRHRECLKDPDVYVVATAEKLYNEVLEARGNKNVLFSGNGVDTKHFQQETDWNKVPRELRRLLQSGRPIIGYYGAVAVWFDYKLILEAADARPDYTFLIIGPQYGNPSKTQALVNKLRRKSNIYVAGTIDYKILPHVANNFTVATIPFVINDITEATSPIKLYEYMAMGKPIVTTAMHECKKHPEVMIAEDAKDYVRLLDQAVAMVNSPDNTKHKKQLLETARRNSWDEKAKEIIDLVENGKG